MEKDSQNSETSQPTQDRSDLTPPTVTQPPELVRQNTQGQSMPPIGAAAVVSQFNPPITAEKNDTMQKEFIPTQLAPPTSGGDVMPVGMAASQLGLDRPGRHFNWRRYARSGMLYPIVLLIVVAAGLLFWRYYIDGMTTKTLSLGGYNYSFSFFRSSKFKQFSNGMQGYTINQDVSAFVGPVVDMPQYCAELGIQYTQAFTVNIYGVTRNVCKVQYGSDQTYAVSFSTQNHNYDFVVVYNQSQNAKVYPKLASIFESIKVTR